MNPASVLRRVIAATLDLFWRSGWRFLATAPTGSTATSPVASLDTITTLRVLLRRYPYWGGGHQRIGEESYDRGDVLLAYAAARCAHVLAPPNSRQASQASHLLGRCYLRQGSYKQALMNLQAAHSGLAKNELAAVKEDEAATHMALGDHDTALGLIEDIDPKYRSPSGSAVLEYLKSKLSSE